MADPNSAHPEFSLYGCCLVDLPAVRRWIRTVLPDDALAVDTQLVTTELVSNALDHTSGPVALRIALAAHAVLIEVDDDLDMGGLVIPGLFRLAGLRGHGLRLVDALSRWGVTRTDTGKTVWAAVPSARGPTQSCSDLHLWRRRSRSVLFADRRNVRDRGG